MNALKPTDLALYRFAVACLALGLIGNLLKGYLPKALAGPGHLCVGLLLGLAATLFVGALVKSSAWRWSGRRRDA